MTDEDQTIDLTADETLLSEIREDYTYFRDYWRENYEEAKIDLRYVSGDPWDPKVRTEREDNGRPVVCPDELEQYLNQAINNLRQNKRAIKVTPTGDGANDQTAERRSAIIRGIEYDSKAQAAYTTAFSGALNCGFGFFRVTTKEVREGEITPAIKIINNPLSVLMDPNAKDADFSDQEKCFLMDVLRQSDFARKYPKAQKRSFSPGDSSIAPGWMQGQNIVIAEYWRVDKGKPGHDGVKITQYITNGFEILEKNEWPGMWIPVIPVLGKETYVPTGGEIKRMFYSMIRKARGPQMMMAYIASQEAEEYGMAPRAPFVGYVGQFETDAEAWETLNKVPRAFVQVDPTVDAASGQLLPLPTRPAFIPNAQAYEIGKESWRRSIMSAMGITPLPTAAQRQNEKSGVALDKIATQQAIGSFHFTDNFDFSLENAGRQLDDLISKVMDTTRSIGIRKADDTHAMLHIVPQGQTPPEGAQPDEVFDPSAGDHNVTVSTGPSYQSQREAASAFVDLLVQELANLPVGPQQKASILAKGIRMKDLGATGDEIAKIIDPQQDGPIPPQAQQAMAQLQQHVQVVTAAAQEYEKQIQQLQFEKQAKVVESQSKLQQIAAQSQADMALEDKKLLTMVTVAEINTKAQNAADRETDRRALEAQFHDQAHDAAMSAVEHQQGMEQQQAQADAQSQQIDQNAQNQSAQSAQDAAQTQEQQEAQQPADGAQA